MEDKDNIVESIIEEAEDQEKPITQNVDIDVIGEAMAAAGRR